jgi:hypothetical protein
MPMNNRLLVPRQTLHPEALAWRSAVIANGGTVSGSTMNAVSRFCRSIDAAGIRSKIRRLNLFCGTGLEAVLVPLYRSESLGGTTYGGTTDTNANFVIGDYEETGATGGLFASSGNEYLDTGFPQTSFPGVTDTHMSTSFSTTGSTAAERVLMGSFNAAPSDYMILRRSITSGNFDGLLYNFFGANNTGAASSPHLMVCRTASNLVTLYNAGASVGTNTTASSGVRTARTTFIGAWNNAGTAANFSIARMRMYSLGAAMTDAQALAFSNAVVAFNTALGRA